MRIRWKLLVLLLVIALLPLIVSNVISRLSTYRLGAQLASETRDVLVAQAQYRLQNLVDNYGRVLDRDRKALEFALRVQAREVERRLAGPPPSSPRTFFAQHYDNKEDQPDGMVLSEKHFQTTSTGELSPIAVNYGEQVYLLPPGVDRQDVVDDVAKLSTMPEAYRFLYESNPELMYWQYASLESGLHTSYPGHGGYPPDYDPRQRRWYRAAKQAGTLVWLPPMVDASTGTITLGLAMPLRRADGTFAGVAAIDVPLPGMFRELRLPDAWSAEAKAMLVTPGPANQDDQGELLIVAQQNYEERGRNWRAPVELQALESEDRRLLNESVASALAGQSGVRRMRYRGRQAFWAWGASRAERLFPVVIVPHELVVAQARQQEQYVLAQVIKGLEIAGLVLLGAVAVVFVTSLLSSRRVTKPIRQLATAARQLAAGDYSARVSIRTRDEIQELGDVFNDIGPKLEERQRMKQALALAMGIQQHLLPQGPPAIEGFDIAGRAVYCDETGGDYYDFIDLVELAPGKLGVAVADVTGHGVGAALLMASARAVLRSRARQETADLGELLEELNVHLARDTGGERFVTLFYGILDAKPRSFRWISAGHDPAILLRAGRDAEELGGSGIPLGLLQEATYVQQGPVTLGPGDVILVGTDGIWEARNPQGEMFGKDRFIETALSCLDAPAERVGGAVFDAVQRFRGARPQQDDITLVVIKAL